MHLKSPLACLTVIAVFALGTTSQLQAQEAAAEDRTAEYKTLDADFARIDGLFREYNDPLHKLTILGYINLLKERAEKLGWKNPDGSALAANRRGRGGGDGYGVVETAEKIEWDQVKYDELRYDINLQAQRLANYLAPLRTLPPSSEPPSVVVAKLSPSPANPGEVKAALDALDFEIKRLEGKAAALPVGSKQHTAETARLNRIKERRTALGREFTKARWDALVGDLK